jgi:transposase
VKLIPAQFVRPFVKSNKNDFLDAEAIAEAVDRQNMRFVPIKTDDQLDLQALHRVRDRLITRRTSVINQCTRLRQIPGIGPLVATAIAIGNGTAFRKGREFAAWMGLVPKQYSTGGKAKLAGISKRGNRYLRKILIHGARAVVLRSKRDRIAMGEWMYAAGEELVILDYGWEGALIGGQAADFDRFSRLARDLSILVKIVAELNGLGVQVHLASTDPKSGRRH